MRQPYHLWNPTRDFIRSQCHDGGFSHQPPFRIVINNNLINGPGTVTQPVQQQPLPLF
ncbi:hypothetical protein ACE1TF_14375 [Geomicrobium sp. JSM 1781026]|uniref:hypothetical protein n=1 Tax=Geomicrobium sp. JSM 1781026 TaxID=3344580 RepID=UPI0035C20D8E